MNMDSLSNQAFTFNGVFVVHVSVFCLQCITVSEKESLIVNVITFNVIVNSSGAHPPPPGNHGAFAQMSVPGVGH